MNLFFAGSDKRIFIQNLSNLAPTDDIVGNFTSMLTALDVDKPMSILGLSEHCVAIYGANTVQDGSSLVLYNTQFKVIQAKQFFKVHFDFSRLWFFSNSILLAMDQGLSVVSYEMRRQLLSDLIGSQVQNQFGERLGEDFINEDEELEENIEFTEEDSNTEHSSHMLTEDEDESVSADGVNVPYYPMENFNTDLSSALNSAGFAVNLIEGDDFDIIANSAPFPTKEIEIVAREMEKCGTSEQEIVKKILHVLLKAKRWEDILVCFKRYTSIPEEMIAKTLFILLESYDENDEIQSKVMKALISCSFDRGKLSQHIRKEFQYITQVLKVLDILYEFITCPKYVLEERSESCEEFDEEMHLFNWFGMFLEAHLTQLIGSKDEKLVECMQKWQTLLVRYRKTVLDLQEIKSFLSKMFANPNRTLDVSYSKWYSIEEIVLS